MLNKLADLIDMLPPPGASGAVRTWDRLPLVAWCLGNLAAIEPPRAAQTPPFRWRQQQQ